MSLSTLKPAVCHLPPASVTGDNGSNFNVSQVSTLKRLAPPSLRIQASTSVTEKVKPMSQKGLTSIPRREMMYLGATSLAFLSLLLPASAEARPRNATIREKILQKLEDLRQKAGLGKPKVESEEKISEDEEKITKPNNESKEKKMYDEEKRSVATSEPNEEPVLPALPKILNGNTVETTLP